MQYDGVLDDDGLPHGRGTLTMLDADGGTTAFSGRFRHGAKHGVGTTTLPNGDVLRGNYADDELESAAPATYAHADGRVLRFRAGQGVECGAHGEVTYCGGVADMVPEGVSALAASASLCRVLAL